MGIEENERRPHHYQFAHKVLAGLAEDLGPRMLDVEPPHGWGVGLEGLWGDFGGRLPVGDRLPSDGLRGEVVTLGPHRLLMVVLPRPIAAAEAYFTAVVQPGGADYCRYFTLELAVNPFTRQSYTVLGEWRDGNHVNHGQGPEPDLSAFLAAVLELLPEPEPDPELEPVPEPKSEPEPAQKPERRGLRGLFGR